MPDPPGDPEKADALPGTRKELEQIVALAGMRRVVRLEGAEASTAALLVQLATAETAHLAMHGFFADAEYRSVLQLDEKLFRHRTDHLSGDTVERIGAGARNPMVLSGLVCSGSNVPGTPNRGVLTAEALAGLDLQRLNLGVLSAYETGLGEAAGGEGVYGLVRAFHIAGARNVVASWWRVEDEATAALMVLFYRYLWGKEAVRPMEALRRAQLAIYFQPGRIKEWSRGIGPLPQPGEKRRSRKTSPTRLWAAFMLSGPGD